MFAGALVLVGTAAGFGAWQAIDSGGARGTALATSATISAPRVVEPTVTYYIVGSEEQAMWVEAREHDAAAIRALNGEATNAGVYQILIAPHDAEAEGLPEVVEANNIRLSSGLPEVKVLDLRGF